MPRMLTDNARLVLSLHLTGTGHGDLARARLNRDKSHGIVILVLVFELGVRIFIMHVPTDNRLTLRLLWRQTQSLKRVNYRLGKGVSGGMADCEFHRCLFRRGSGN